MRVRCRSDDNLHCFHSFPGSLADYFEHHHHNGRELLSKVLLYLSSSVLWKFLQSFIDVTSAHSLQNLAMSFGYLLPYCIF